MVVSVFVVVSKVCNTRRAAEEVEFEVLVGEVEFLVELFRFMVLLPLDDGVLLESVDDPSPVDELSEGRHDLGAGNRVPI